MKHEINSKLGDVCIAGDAFAKELHRLFEVVAAVPIADESHHCGQDTGEHQPAGYTYKDLLGMEVISYGGKAMKCEGCSWNWDNCVKVELAGGDYLCLTNRQQEEKTVISFDEEESNPLADIKEKTEAFLDYLDSIFNTKEE